MRGAVVQDAVMLGIMMAGEEHERGVLARSWPLELGNEERRLAPASVDFRAHRGRDLLAPATALSQYSAVIPGDCCRGCSRQLAACVLRGAAPDRRYAHLVEMLGRTDVKLAYGCRPRSEMGDLLGRNALAEGDSSCHYYLLES